METRKQIRHDTQPIFPEQYFPNTLANGSECRTCVICVGSTGTGKTSTIQKCTLENDVIFSESNGNNASCRLYQCQQEMVDDLDDLHSDFLGRFLWKSLQELVWVDTIGWNDKDRDGDLKLKCCLFGCIFNFFTQK